MKKILSLLLSLSLLMSMFTVIICAESANPTITSVVAINDTQFKVTTSKPITAKGNYFALYISKNGVVENLDERDCRFGGTIEPLNTATTEFTWTINAGGNATQVINSARASGHRVYFGLNGAVNSGMIDTGRAVDSDGKGFIPNLTTQHFHGIYGVEAKAYATFTVYSVKAIDDYRLEIEFTKPLSSFDGAVLFGVLEKSGTGLYNYDSASTLDDHAVMAYEIKDGKLECWLNSDKSGMGTQDGKNITKFVAAVKTAYPDHKAGIALLEANDDSIKNTGYLEQVVDEEGTPLKGTGTLSGRDLYVAAIAPAKEGGFVAFWDFEDVSGTTLKEVTGNIADGTINGGATTVAVKEGCALKLDGVDDSIDIPYHEDIKFEKTDSFAMSLWFNVDENISEGWHMLAGMGRSSGVAWYGFYLSGDGTLYW